MLLKNGRVCPILLECLRRDIELDLADPAEPRQEFEFAATPSTDSGIGEMTREEQDARRFLSL
jgi:hypothetical protein